MKDNWYIYTKRADFGAIAAKYGIDPVTARVMRNRDYISDEDLDYFFNATIDDLYDETLIPDLTRAADIVWDAVRHHRKIRIVGDYDIDGVSATYILFDGLTAVGADVDYRIPERVKDGYGINMRIIEEAYRDGTELILTCDNGISAFGEVLRAGELGIDVVITDHHDLRIDSSGRDIFPEALAVADVKRRDSEYPTRETCGAVTAWKLIKLIYKIAGRDRDEWLKYLEFAAIATVGDIMELRGENRVIVKEGLKRLGTGPVNLGLGVLIDELGLKGRAVTAYHIGFVIGPVINAGGRLETAESVMKLLQSRDEAEARLTAGHLKALNEERKALTERGVQEGIELIERGECGESVLVVYLPGLHESLAGIVAGRLKERYYKPCYVITDAIDGLKGSGRSIESYDMFGGLLRADSLLSKYGGHRMAAGLSLETDRLGEFKAFINEHAGLSEEDLRRIIWIDVVMPLSYVTKELITELDALNPFGAGFKKPVFADRALRPLDMRVMGKSRNALRITLADADGRRFNSIMFGEADRLMDELSGRDAIDILYYPEINTYRGVSSIEINIESFR